MPKIFDIFPNKAKKPKKIKSDIKVIIDTREKNSLVISELSGLSVSYLFKQLSVGDYIIGKTVIERKTISDLKSSIINKRIQKQLRNLKQYRSKFLIIEGFEKDEFYDQGIHENALRGFILSLLSEHKIPVIFTLNEKDTAKYISLLAVKKKRQKKEKIPLRQAKTFLSEKEQLQFILEGFPNIGPVTAKRLLSHFKNLRSLSNTSKEELEKLIGKKSEKIHALLNLKY